MFCENCQKDRTSHDYVRSTNIQRKGTMGVTRTEVFEGCGVCGFPRDVKKMYIKEEPWVIPEKD